MEIVARVGDFFFGFGSDLVQCTTKLVDDILAVEPTNPRRPVRVPGINGSKRKEKAQVEGFVEIDDTEWQKFDI